MRNNHKWTFSTLQAFIEQRIDNLEKMLNERYQTQTKATDAAFVAQQTAMKTAFDAADKAVQAALAAAKEAAAKAEAAAKDRFAAVNEFRGQLSDQAATLVSRTEHNAQLQALADKIDVLGARLNALELRLTSRLDLGQGHDEGSSHQTDSRQRSMALAGQWIALAVIAIGLVVTILVAVL
jgi:hypothetical protein